MYIGEFKIIGKTCKAVGRDIETCAKNVIAKIREWQEDFKELDIRLTPTKWEVHNADTPDTIEAMGCVTYDEELRYY